MPKRQQSTWTKLKKSLLEGAMKVENNRVVPDNKVFVFDTFSTSACGHIRDVVSCPKGTMAPWVHRFFTNFQYGSFAETDNYLHLTTLEDIMSVPKYIYDYENAYEGPNTKGLTNFQQLLQSNEAVSRENTKLKMVNKSVSVNKRMFICSSVDQEKSCYLVDEKWGNEVEENITFTAPTSKKRNINGVHAYRRRGGWHEHVYGMYLHCALHGLDYTKCLGNFGSIMEAVEAMDHYARKEKVVLRHPDKWPLHYLRCETVEGTHEMRPFIITDTEAKWGLNGDSRWANVMAERKKFLA